jgi:hypothetical protein
MLAAALTSAKDVLDGTTPERAIMVPGDSKHYVDWEWDYLQKRFFDGHAMPKEHALIEHKGHMYDSFVFSTRSGDKVIYFDVTRFHSSLVGKLPSK